MAVFYLDKLGQNPFGVLEYSYAMFRFLGLIHFEKYKEGKDTFCKYREQKFSFCTLCRMSLATILNISCHLLIFGLPSEIHAISKIIMTGGGINGFQSMFTSFYLYFKQTHFVQVQNSLISIDDKLKSLGLRFSYRNQSIIHLALVVFGARIFVLHLIYILTYSDACLAIKFGATVQHFNFSFGCTVAVFYISFNIGAVVRLHYMVLFMSELDMEKISASELKKYLKIVGELHDQISKFIVHLNDFLSYNVFFYICGTTICCLLSVLLVMVGNIKMPMEIAMYAFAVTFVYLLCIIVAQVLTYFINQSTFFLSGLNIPLEYEEQVLQKNLLLLQILQRKIKYSAARVFDLNMKIITAHFGSLVKLILFLNELKKHARFGND